MGLKDINWNEIQAAGTSNLIPAGGYVAVIQQAEDFEKAEYVQCLYDIAEGAQAGFFANDTRPYTHRFIKSYKQKAWPFFKQFLDMLEESNPNFNIDAWNGDASAFNGLKIGVIIQREDYTNNSGEDRARMNVEEFATVEDIRNGRYKLPEPKDTREKAQGTSGNAPTEPSGNGANVYDADLPF